MVPNDTTAIKVAEAIWLPIYGRSIYQELPFTARLEGDSVWVVEGSLPGKSGESVDSKGNTIVTMVAGGVVTARIRKSDCKVLEVYHTK